MPLLGPVRQTRKGGARLIISHGTAVKLSITHTIEREPSSLIVAVSGGFQEPCVD